VDDVVKHAPSSQPPFMSILVEGRWKIHIRLVRLGQIKGFTMSKQPISIFLVLLLLVPLINTASADEVEGPNLEAKNFSAVVDSDSETTTLSWGNIDTNDFEMNLSTVTTTWNLNSFLNRYKHAFLQILYQNVKIVCIQ
jgi:hypothetical protein